MPARLCYWNVLTSTRATAACFGLVKRMRSFDVLTGWKWIVFSPFAKGIYWRCLRIGNIRPMVISPILDGIFFRRFKPFTIGIEIELGRTELIFCADNPG